MGSYQHVSNLLDVITFLLVRMDQEEANGFDIRLIINNIKTHSDIIENAKRGEFQELNETNEVENLFNVISFLLKASSNSQNKTDLILNQFKILNEILLSLSKVTNQEHAMEEVNKSNDNKNFECEEYDVDDNDNLKEEGSSEEEDPHDNQTDNKKVDEDNSDTVTISIKKREQDVDSVYKCIFCDIGFKSKVDADAHDNQNHLVNGEIKCSDCEFCSLEKKIVCEHFIITHGKLPFLPCGKCTNVFLEFAAWKDHMVVEHGIEVDKEECPMCLRKINARDQWDKLKNHMWSEHNPGHSLCKICGKKFKTRKAIYQHMHIYHKQGGPKRIKCDICGKDVIKANFKDHMDLHNATEKSFQCPQCPKTYYTEGQLKIHVDTNHLTPLKMCEICDYTTPRGERLRRHMLKHSDVRPFKCDQCEMAFKTKQELKNHITTHTGARNFPCTVCGKAFRSSTNLNEHRAIHEGRYRGHCKICDKKFVQRYNYKMHMDKHHPNFQIEK